ncbi:MAG: 4-alpha-glucanotransferase [Coriobacteriales bacterium]|nr:4-alpha-glucanotransferase [Coriobacteriales bacterium]
MKRASGVILPLFSLPSPYGVGTMGQAARDFVDFLADAGQSWWQVLPVGPTSYGDSPYQSPSAFAGNPNFVDLDLLVADGLLLQDEIDAPNWGDDPTRVDYGALYKNRLDVLRLACDRGWQRDAGSVRDFVQENDDWLDDYALFMAIKRRFGMAPWYQWPDEEIRLHRPDAIRRYERELDDDVRLFVYVQYLFFRQWADLRAYARGRGVGIFGDMPIYVALDSADVWAHPENYQLDERNNPAQVAGVPPDYFSSDGQLWGNPLYDYKTMEKSGFAWWKRRVQAAGRLYDMVRIDHFRGFARYWSVPAGATTAKDGHWVDGPGMKLVGTLKSSNPEVELVAEDLGTPTPEVMELLLASGLPGMKVLQFAFDGRRDNEHLPHGIPVNCLCYTGTHDNAPLGAWFEEESPQCLDLARRYVGLNSEEGPVWGMVRQGMSSVAVLFFAQMQDYLELGPSSRVNTPGTMDGNWRWRLRADQLTRDLSQRMASITRLYGRD